MILVLILTNIFLFYYKNKICNFFGLLDTPDDNLKKHTSNVPLYGGILFLTNIIVFFICDFFFRDNLEIYYFFDNTKQIITASTLVIIITLFGLYDDKFLLNPWRKFQVIVLFLIIFIPTNSRLVVEFINFNDFSFQLGVSKYVFTILCYFFLLNAYNFYDGVNCNLLSHFLLLNIYFLYLTKIDLYLFLSIVTIVALYFNFKNQIFLGDSGAFILSMIVSISLINFTQYQKALYVEELILLVFFPAIDLVRVSLLRLTKGKNPLIGDLNHLHHIMVRKIGLNIFLLLKTTLTAMNILSIIYLKNYLIYIIIINFIFYILFLYHKKT